MRWPAAAVDRRTLLIGGGAGVGLIIAWAVWPRRAASPLRAAKGEQVFGPFLRISEDGRVTVALPQAETGQGAWTGLAQITADELGAAWQRVAVEPAPVAPGYDNAVLGEALRVHTRLTAQSSSVRAFERPLREAAAVARLMLCAAAAERWSIDVAQCDAIEGEVTAGGNRRLGFGALAAAAARLDPPFEAPLRPAGTGRIAGQSLPRLDLPAKSDGSLRFAGDVRLPGLRFAAVRLAPPRGHLGNYERGADKRGARLIADKHWLAAIAETGWAAEQALGAAAPRFVGPANADTPAIEEAVVRALQGPMERFAEHGDYEQQVGGRRALAATYTVAPAPHLGLEPPAVTVRLSDGRLELWIGTQAPDLARKVAADAAGIDPAQVMLYLMPVGDSGGRGIENELLPVAVQLARQTGAPLCVALSASQGQNHDSCRPPMAARISALPDAAGGLASWHARFAGAAGIDAALARLGSGDDPPDFVPRGGVPPYSVAALRVESATAKLPIRCGYLRGDVEAMTSFATESFVDELARARGVEPLAFRIGLLGQQPRLARVLTTAAAQGGWDGGARGSSLGIAGASGYGSHIGLLAEASIGSDQRVRVTRLVAAVDAGRLINPALVRQQVEGGLLHALVTAAGPAPEIISGMPRARPLGALGLSRLGAVPRVDVILIRSRARPGGVSGLGALVLAAAVGNAVFAATGLRLRRLPFDPMTPA